MISRVFLIVHKGYSKYKFEYSYYYYYHTKSDFYLKQVIYDLITLNLLLQQEKIDYMPYF